MILTALVPCRVAKFGDIVRYFRNGAQQVDCVWDLSPSTDDAIGVDYGAVRIPYEHVLDVTRPITITPGDVWLTQRHYEARILETAAPGLYPIVALIVINGTSTPAQFTVDGLSQDRRHRLICPRAMEEESCRASTTTTSETAETTTSP